MKKIIFTMAVLCGFTIEALAAKDPCQGAEGQDRGESNSSTVQSCDPNEMAGPLGKGEKRYVEQGEWMNYTIYFENKTNATAAAQEVFVDLPMDPNFDWSTLELGEIVFGEHIDTSLSGKSHGKSSYAMPGTNTFVKTTVTMKDGVLSWYLRDWDPTTVDNFPASATGGFLPPNDPNTHCGEGHLSFRVRVKPDAPAGSVIRASAQIVFDSNPMIETDPSWWNTVGTLIDVDCGDGLKIPGLVVGMPYGKLPVPSPREGYEFGGWFTGPDGTGEQITEKSIVKAGAKLYGYWIPVRPLIAGKEVSGNAPDNAASVYDGYLYDEETDAIMGTIQAKVSKPKLNKKLGVTTAKTSVAIQVTGEKKITLKGELDLNIGEFTATDKKSGRVLILKFGSKGISGSFGKYDIDGARNFFDSKDKDEKSAAEEILKPYLGAYSMICDGGILSVNIAKKGKVTVKGAIDDNKVSAKAQVLIGEDVLCIPVIYSKKSVNLAFTIWLPIDGSNAEVIGLGDNAIIGKAGTLKNGAQFIIDGDIGASIETEDERTLELLPDNETITVSKSKWLVADGIKPAKVAYKKGEFTITEGWKGAGIANPSGLKLTYKSKDGSFKGSFTAYGIVKGKLKKHKASVEGVLVNGVGYGTITIKKIGTWAVTIK